MARRRGRSPWDAKMLHLLVAAGALGGGIWYGLPLGGLYVAVAIVVASWPRPEEFDLDTPGFERAGKVRQFSRALLQPLTPSLWFGSPGQHSQQPATWWPPTRVSSFLGLLVAAATTVLLLAVPWEVTSPLANGAIAFVLWQSLCAGARAAAHPSDQDAFPAALVDREVLERVGPTGTYIAPISAAVVAGLAATFATVRFASGLELAIPGYAPALIGVLAFVAVGLGVFAAGYIREYNQPLRDHLEAAQLWHERWEQVPKMSVMAPVFTSQHVQPPAHSGQDETHKVVFFKVPPGAVIEDYRSKTEQLTNVVAESPGEAEYVLVSPMQKLNDQKQPIPGTRQEGAFKVTYNTVPLPERAHLTTGMDNWTTVFVIHRAFDRAFVSLKLGMADLVRVQPLHAAGSDIALYETIWNLPADVTYDKLVAKSTAIAEKVGAEWVRVGRHTKDSAGVRIPDAHVSIVFGRHPDHVELADPRLRPWLESLDLELAFYSLNLGTPLLEDTDQLSMPGFPDLMEARFRLDSSVAWGDVIKKTSALQEKLSVPWLRITRRVDGDDVSPLVSVLYGAKPADTMLLSDPPDYDPAAINVGDETNPDRLFLDSVDWDAWFRTCKLVGSDGSSPSVVTKTTNEQGVSSYQMRHVPGLALDSIKDGIPAMRASSKLGYIEVEDEPDDAGLFRLMAGKVDPLEKPYLAMDYINEPKPRDPLGRPMLHDPVLGQPDINWVVGPGADGELMEDRWEGDNPHLFVGGASGSGKSIAILSMLLQMMHNNHPKDVKFALADPKTELVYFEDAAHVNHFIGLNTPGFAANPFRAMADLLNLMRDETYRRNTEFVNHPMRPQNLSQARWHASTEVAHAIAGTIPENWPTGTAFPWWPGGPDDHPFLLPFQFIVLEECSTFFKAPASKEQRPDHEEVIGHVEELARIARSAGVFMTAATQYPKKENISTTLLAQCRRIGLPMNRVGSMLTIEEAGLEKLDTPGRGKMSYGKTFRGMRVLFVRVPDEKNPDIADDRAFIYDRVMKKDGSERRPSNPLEAAALAGPSVVAAPPPSPDGLWVPTPSAAPMPPPPALRHAVEVQTPQGPALVVPLADNPTTVGEEAYPDLDDIIGSL